MTDKEKKSKIADILMDFQEEYSNEVINRPMLASLYAGNILSFIDSLQEEPISEQNLSNVERIRKNWKEEPISEDLEEACEQLSEDARKHKAETSSPFFSQTDYKQGVIDGAKWQKEKMMTKAIDGTARPDDSEIWCNLASSNLKDGDEVKVIVIKED